ncbi:MAG: phytanoyl-CoA dioxygenase family protein [Acidimicrobiales bacterium]
MDLRRHPRPRSSRPRAGHHWGGEHPDDRQDAEMTAAEMVAAEMGPGSVLVFDAALWHRGAVNHTSGTRLCLTVQYCQPWLRPHESQLLIAPPNVATRLSDRVRAMVGYSIHPPFIGQVDGKHPLRLVDEDAYRANRGEGAACGERILRRPDASFSGR